MKTRTLTLGVMMLGLFATSVQAETKNLKDVIPELTGILKTGVSQYEAERICQDEDMRLPTARELALDAIKREVLPLSAISETKKDGYDLVEGSDSAGNPDYFYFSYKGYERPTGKLGGNWVWSSSVHPDDSDDAYRFDNFDGVIDEDYRELHISNAVRCVERLK